MSISVGNVLFAAAALFLLFLIAAIVLSYLQAARSGRRSSCTNNLKQFGIALHNYHDTHKCFPPVVIRNSDGKPIHSWRAILLPYFEEAGLKGLYRLDEPWGGPHNLLLAKRMAAVFHCPNDVETDSNTSYVAVTGRDGAWPLDKPLTIKDFKDGLPNTILLVEVHNSGINWLEPRDLTFEEAVRGINPRDGKLGISSAHRGGANVLFADGAVYFLSNDTPPETLRALLTANGGEDVRLPE